MNAVPVSGIDYAPDPHGAQLFSSLARAINRTLNGARPIAEHSATWYGWTPTLQQFRGAAGVGLGAGKVYAPNTSTINEQKTTTDANVSDIFRSRMARGIRG